MGQMKLPPKWLRLLQNVVNISQENCLGGSPAKSGDFSFYRPTPDIRIMGSWGRDWSPKRGCSAWGAAGPVFTPRGLIHV